MAMHYNPDGCLTTSTTLSIMPTSSSLTTPQLIIITNYGVKSIDKVRTITTLVYFAQWCLLIGDLALPAIICYWDIFYNCQPYVKVSYVLIFHIFHQSNVHNVSVNSCIAQDIIFWCWTVALSRLSKNTSINKSGAFSESCSFLSVLVTTSQRWFR